MDEKIDFGQCLNRLLMVRGWSGARLAKEINLDSSYVRRWIRGDRVPSVKSNYVEQIADCLTVDLNIESKKPIRTAYMEALINMGFDIDESQPVREITQQALAEAQLYSLKADPIARKAKNTSRDSNVSDLLERIHAEVRAGERASTEYQSPRHISAIPTLIRGREEVLGVFISLAQAAHRQAPTADKEDILITFQSEKHTFDGYPHLYKQMEAEMTKTLQRGWNIKHLWRLNKNVDRSIMLVNKIIGLLGYKGKYQPRYFVKYGTLMPSYELMVVPGVGAVVCIATQSMERVDAAFFYHHPESVEALYGYAKQLLADTEPLLNIVTIGEYYEKVTESDYKEGDRFIIKDDLDSLTLPYELWVKYLHRTMTDQTLLEIHKDHLKKRIDNLNDRLKRYKSRHIYPMLAIEHLVKSGSYYVKSKFKAPNREDIIQHLTHIIYLLKNYDNYEIGLLSDSQAEMILPNYMEVKGDHTVIMNAPQKRSGDSSLEESRLLLTINEGTLVGTFRDYFLEIWEKITPRHREKEYVISWLEERIRWLEND